MAFDPIGAAIGLGTSIGSAIFGSTSAASSDRKARKEQKKAVKEQHRYNKSVWRANKAKLRASRQEAIERIDLQKKNEQKLADFKDANNLQSYNYSMQIRNLQQKQLNDQFAKSEQLYDLQTDFNSLAAKQAKSRAQKVLFEETQKFAFQNQASILEALAMKGKMRARGQSGRSSRKTSQAVDAQLGVSQAQLAESLVSILGATADREQDIDQQQLQADTQAWAQRMLPPDTIPDIPVPFKTPLAEYQYPRELQDFDFGPEPKQGAAAVGGTSWSSAFASYLPNIAEAATPFIAQMFTPMGGGKMPGRI